MIFPLTTGSTGKRIDLAVRDGECPDWLSPGQFFFEVKFDRFTDISHQLIECLTLGEYINPYPPATPESSIRIDFKFDEHGHPLSSVILEENNAFDEPITEIKNAVDFIESITYRIRFSS